jgi:hypothetical protein
MNIRPDGNRTIPNYLTMPNRSLNGTAVCLNGKLTNSEARINNEVKQILTGILKEAIITVHNNYFYYVDFGPGVQPRLHIVSHDLYCSDLLLADCPAVTTVKIYLLRRTGEVAKIPTPGFFPAVPSYCPICSARAFYEPRLSSHHRGVGWRCSKYGTAHYWQHQGMIPRPACSV